MQQICGMKSSNKTQYNTPGNRYYIQLGCFKNCNNALDFQLTLFYRGIKSDIKRKGNWYCVWTQGITSLDEAAFYEIYLKHQGYDTILIS